MSEYTIQHGGRHSPRGSDPALCDDWNYVATQSGGWSSSTTYSGGNTVGHLGYNFVALATSHNVEPGVAAGWGTYWYFDSPYFQNGVENQASSTGVPNPMPMRYRLSIGPPNDCEYDTTSPFKLATSIDRYTEHQIEFQGDITGPSYGVTAFVIPLEYRHDYDVAVHTHDDVGLYVPCRLLSTGAFVYGSP